MQQGKEKRKEGQIVKECEGCLKVIEGRFCKAYRSPTYMWNKGRCPLCSVPMTKAQEAEAKKLNPLKESKGKGGTRPNTGRWYSNPGTNRRKKYIKSGGEEKKK